MRTGFGVLALCACLVACGEGPPGGQGATDVSTDASEDVGQVDTTSPDTTSDDAGAPDTAALCPGGAGCPCDASDDCDNNLCIHTPAGKQCAKTCVDACPDGFDCQTVSTGGADAVQLCVPKWGFLCAPCSADSTCQEALGDHGSYCMRYGTTEGSFCGSTCAVDADCPGDFVCNDGKTHAGEARRACVRKDLACPCSPRSATLKLSTVCQAVGELGTCPGSRTCTSAGALGDCTAPPAVSELCDGLDNDCNGATDEGLCDDDNVCTTDACIQGGTQCSHTPVAGACDDGDACTSADACDAKGGCLGQVVPCDDANPCTTDACDKLKGCVYTPHKKPCDDSNACTANDLCDGNGACVGLSIDVSVTCDDSEPCTTDGCDPKAPGSDTTAGCTNTPKAGPCEDGNPCTNGDACDKGGCKPGGNVCACTTDAQCAAKEDGDLCNGTLYCDKAKAPFVCKIDPKSVVTCDTSKDTTCAKTACDAKTGKCGSVPAQDNKACDADGSVCTVGDVCKAGVCAPGAKVDCDDKNPCTNDSCDPSKGCQSANNIAPCDKDGDACTVGDSCKNGLCTAGASKSCDDGEVCTVDACDPKTGACSHVSGPQDGKPCDADQSKCTAGDACQAGKCVAGKALDCDDGKVCTKDSCNAASGCEQVPEVGKSCDDGDPCTGQDGCKGGSCVGTKLVCDDGNPCTDDSCGSKGCVFEGVKDGASCGGGKHCVAKKCVVPSCGDGYVGKGEACDDGNGAVCDGCEACQPRGNLSLDGAAYAQVAAPTPGKDGLAGPFGLVGDLTVEAWVRPTTVFAELTIVSKASKALGASTFTLSLSGGQLLFSHVSPLGPEFIAAKVGGKAKVVPANQWAHVAAVVVGDTVRLYVGGLPAGGGKLFKPRFDVPGAGVTVGRTYWDAKGGEFKGQIDEVHVARAALHGGAFVPARTTSPDPTTVALWRFDGDAKDAGPQGLDLTLKGALLGKDSCLGRSAAAAVCGDGQVDTALETCDDKNGAACDGCEGCRLQRSFHVNGQGAMQTAGFPEWAADTVCPTCTMTLEAWVRVDDTTGTFELLGASCGIFSLMVSQTTNGTRFGLVRFPLPPLFAKTTVKAGVWYHVAAVAGFAQGAPLRVYVDGKLEASASAQLPAALPGWQIDKEVLFLGGGAKGTGQGCVFKKETPIAANRLPGRLDEVRVSAGARYGASFTPRRRLLPDAATRGLWRFDSPLGLTSDDSGHSVATKLLAGDFIADQCYGDLASSATCGDGQAARWEACDNGMANGAWPKKCNVLCAPNVAPDCTSVAWTKPAGLLGKNTAHYDTGAWTLEGWARVKALPTSGFGALVAVDEPGTGAGCASMKPSLAWRVGVGAAGLDQSKLGGAGEKASPSKVVWRAGVWQHFALQAHGDGTGSLFVDGALARSFSGVGSGWSASCPLRFGDQYDGKTHPLDAELAALRWSPEMRYGAAFVPPTTLEPVGTWQFELSEGSGAVATDQIKGFKLTLPGVTWSKTAGPGCVGP